MLTVSGLHCTEIAERLGQPYWRTYRWLADEDPDTDWFDPPPVRSMVSGVKSTKCRALERLGFSIREIGRALGLSVGYVHYLLSCVNPSGDPTFVIELKESVQDIEGCHLKAGGKFRCFLHNEDHLIMQQINNSRLYFVKYDKLLNRIEVEDVGLVSVNGNGE